MLHDGPRRQRSRLTGYRRSSEVGPDPGLRLGVRALAHVKTEHPLIGETRYVPQVMVTNNSDSPITITSVELVAKRGTNANKPRQPGSYPLAVPPGKTETLDIWFDLADYVKEIGNPLSCRCTTRVVVRTKPLMCRLSAGRSTRVRPRSHLVNTDYWTTRAYIGPERFLVPETDSFILLEVTAGVTLFVPEATFTSCSWPFLGRAARYLL